MMLGERITVVDRRSADRSRLRAPLDHRQHGCGVGLKPSAELVALADAALYRSKAEGRNRVTWSLSAVGSCAAEPQLRR